LLEYINASWLRAGARLGLISSAFLNSYIASSSIIGQNKILNRISKIPKIATKTSQKQTGCKNSGHLWETPETADTHVHRADR
jgi:hypothetical protein